MHLALQWCIVLSPDYTLYSCHNFIYIKKIFKIAFDIVVITIFVLHPGQPSSSDSHHSDLLIPNMASLLPGMKFFNTSYMYSKLF